LECAKEDAGVARLMADAEVPDRIVGFHAQQAVEMFLKAVLSLRGIGYERTHDIERLASLISEGGVEPPPDLDDLAQLTPWAVERRYGDPLRPRAAGPTVGATNRRGRREMAGRAFAASDH
jgi:HEPN domain-containing protein